jgi:hypothetical protein
MRGCPDSEPTLYGNDPSLVQGSLVGRKTAYSAQHRHLAFRNVCLPHASRITSHIEVAVGLGGR